MIDPNDPNDPDAPGRLLARAFEIIQTFEAQGVDPFHDPTDLMLVGLIPLAIKRAMGVDPWEDQALLDELVRRMDLRELAEYIRTRTH